MNTRTILSCIVILSIATAPVTAQQQYVLGPGDLLEISVYGNEDVSRVVPVRPDGMISLPLIGEVRAAGITPEQLRQQLTALYLAYFRNPQVTVIVKEIRRIHVSALGQVTKPGVYDLLPGSTVLDALAAAQGLTSDAGLGEVRITRGQDLQILIDLERLLLRGEITLNIQLESGDSLLVPEDPTAHVYVLGEVARPSVLPLRGTMTVLQALTLAGGPTRRAMLGQVYVVRRAQATQAGPSITLATVTVERQSPSSVSVVPVDVLKIIRDGDVSRDLLLRRGDLLYVPENPYALENIAVLLGVAGNIAVLLR